MSCRPPAFRTPVFPHQIDEFSRDFGRTNLVVVAQSLGGFTAPTKFLLCRDDRFFPAEFMR
jgi:hypothetical protein